MKYLISSILMLCLLSACSSSTHIKYRVEPPKNFSVIHAVGYAPISTQRGSNKTEKMLNAMRASKLEAYRELTEQVHGFSLQGNSKFSDLVLQDSNLNASVQGLIRGAKVTKSFPLSEDIYSTELALDFKTVYQLYNNSSLARKVTN